MTGDAGLARDVVMKGEHVQIEWSDLEVERCGSPR